MPLVSNSALNEAPFFETPDQLNHGVMANHLREFMAFSESAAGAVDLSPQQH